jgi:hypothetical protein
MATETKHCQFPDGKLAYSIKKFADLTDFGRTTIYEAIKSGSLVARKNGTRTVITAPDGMRWLRSLPPANPASCPPNSPPLDR